MNQQELPASNYSVAGLGPECAVRVAPNEGVFAVSS